MTTAEKAVQWAVGIAKDDSHGYDQANRWGADYDCSSLVISAYKAAGVPLESTYTGNMWRDFLNHGFSVPSGVDLMTGAGLVPGDVLLNEKNHTAMYIGNGQIVSATINEMGTVSGGQTGDQTGKEIGIGRYYNFPWDCVLRYDEPVEHDSTGQYVVQKGDTLWSIAEKLYGNPWKYHEIEKANRISNAMIYPGQCLIIPGVDVEVPEKVMLEIEVDKETSQLLHIMAEGNHKTIGEVIDMLLEDAR